MRTTRPLRPSGRTASPASPVTLILAALLLATAAQDAGAATPLKTVRVASGLARPLFVTAPPGDTARVFIVEARGADARGRIRILKNGALLPTPFLTTQPLSTGSEQGLLGLAFAPDYATSGRFYISYTNASGTSILQRHTVSAFPDTAHAAGTILLSLSQPFTNHNGGWIAFGPDGHLYWALGDGGSAGDPGDRAQNLDVLYGKILRLDVSGATYSIPPDNPYAGATPGLDEIWALGLRNPWRNCFDRATGDLIVADVGQEDVEEVNFLPAGTGATVNFGWRCFEGDSFYTESATISCGSCLAPGCPKTFPVHSYTHTLGRCSITGGYVYRGCAIPDLQGEYFFADYCSGAIYSGRLSAGGIAGLQERTTELAPGGGLSIGSISSFGEDARGEIYICDLGGEVFKIVPAAAPLESAMPALRVRAATGDSLGATALGNAVLPGAIPFAGAGSRIRGVGYLQDAALLGCVETTPVCLTARTRLAPFEIEYEACADTIASTLTRRFVFRNTGGAPAALDFVDAAAALWNGNEDSAVRLAPQSPGQTPLLVQFDGAAPSRYALHWGSGAAGVAYSAEVDTFTQIEARVAGDAPIEGETSAGPAFVGMALGFDFGSVAAGAAESVMVVTKIQDLAPAGVVASSTTLARLRLRVLGAMPFRDALSMRLELPRAARVDVDVYDVQGRRVRSLHQGALPAGLHPIRWDGTSASGRAAASGVYFVRARADGRSESRSVVLIR
ncbi:MAG TPA: PQQ-dependent sugar dehydrogenase [Acidobacteriota bacterium]|nr:PQQ-dependent sugar dehydrogenase [Acidobacteriota bacterium]